MLLDLKLENMGLNLKLKYLKRKILSILFIHYLKNNKMINNEINLTIYKFKIKIDIFFSLFYRCTYFNISFVFIDKLNNKK